MVVQSDRSGIRARLQILAEAARRRFTPAGFVEVVTFALLVGLPGGSVWGQPAPAGVQEATGSEESRQSDVPAADLPVDDLNRGTPRSAVRRGKSRAVFGCPRRAGPIARVSSNHARIVLEHAERSLAASRCADLHGRERHHRRRALVTGS